MLRPIERSDPTRWRWETATDDVDSRRVLVVGAAAAARGFLALLRRMGAQVMPCRDIESAAFVLRRLAIDVVIVDPELRCADGRALSSITRAAGPSADARFLAPPPHIGLALLDPRAA
ncbi:MAG TPA: hypothetical protein VFG69_02905 [Nannocystaceae bacterium]|nr:hypothetical protein [Nannocystaceae bacterium]